MNFEEFEKKIKRIYQVLLPARLKDAKLKVVSRKVAGALTRGYY